MLDAARADPAAWPELKRIVVAIDPAVSAGEKSDETGMIVAGLGADGLVYVLADASGRFSPDEWRAAPSRCTTATARTALSARPITAAI